MAKYVEISNDCRAVAGMLQEVDFWYREGNNTDNPEAPPDVARANALESLQIVRERLAVIEAKIKAR